MPRLFARGAEAAVRTRPGSFAAFYGFDLRRISDGGKDGACRAWHGMANTGLSPNGSSRHRVLIAGGGVAALEAMLALRELAGPLVDVELIAPEPHFWYRPLAVAEPFGLGSVHRLELAQLCEQAGADFSLGTLVDVDHARRRVQTHHGELAYDSLLVAIGAVGTEAIPGAFTFRGPADSHAYQHLLTELEQGAVRQLVFALPGGQSWPLPLYELALLTAAFVECAANLGRDTERGDAGGPATRSLRSRRGRRARRNSSRLTTSR